MPPPRRSKASGLASVNCPPPPENDSEAYTLGIYKLSNTPSPPYTTDSPNTEPLEYGVQQHDGTWFRVPNNDLRNEDVLRLKEHHFGLPSEVALHTIDGMPLLPLLRREPVSLSTRQSKKIQRIQTEIGFSTNTRNLQVLTRYNTLLHELGFNNPTYNHTIRSLLESKVRIALKNQKARLQQQLAFYLRPIPPSLDPQHKYSWAQWMLDDSITDQDKERSKPFYDAEMILRASAHTMTPDETGKLLEYLDLGRKGCDIQEWRDSRRNVPPETESVPSTNSGSTGKRDRALSSSSDSASKPCKQRRIV